jgi:hypothetical protein
VMPQRSLITEAQGRLVSFLSTRNEAHHVRMKVAIIFDIVPRLSVMRPLPFAGMATSHSLVRAVMVWAMKSVLTCGDSPREAMHWTGHARACAR